MHWRKSTWALIVWTALMVVWLALSVSATTTSCPATGGSGDDCGAYAGIAVAAVALVWLAGAGVLSAVWYATRVKSGGGEMRWGEAKDQPSGPSGR